MTPQALAATHRAAFGDNGWDAETLASYQGKPFHLVHGSEDCFAVLSVVADCAEILTLATHPERQRQGLATELLEDLHAVLDAQGVREVVLEVAADNAAGIRLYETAGYTTFAERKDYYRSCDGGRVTALRMRKTL